MNSQLKAPVMLIIVGLPGSGKTQLARRLARKLKIHAVHAEKVRLGLRKQLGQSPVPGQLVNKVCLLLLEEFARLKLSVVCDLNTQTQAQRQELYKLAQRYKLQPLVIYQQVDRQTSWLRYQGLQNAKKGLDMEAHRRRFQSLADRLEPPAIEQTIAVSGLHTLEAQLQIILCKLLANQLLDNGHPGLKKVAKPGLINLVAAQARRPNPDQLSIHLRSKLELREEN